MPRRGRFRVTGSAWTVVNGGTTDVPGSSGVLGASQSGVRAYLPLARGFALTGRVSAPLSGAGADAALGVALRRGVGGLIVEQRLPIDRGGRRALSAVMFADLPPVLVSRSLRLTGYGQVGIVGRDGFADGAVRLDRSLGSDPALRPSIGVFAAAAAQPGAARVDVGPHATVRFSLANANVRVTADWRWRIAGTASPANGPALTIATDF